MKITKTDIYIYTLYLIFINEWFTNMPIFSEYYVAFKNVVLSLLVLLLIFNAFISRFNVQEWVIFILMESLAIYTYICSSVVWIVYLVFLIFFSKKVGIKKLEYHIKKIMKFILFINITVFIVKFLFFPHTLLIVTSRNMNRYDINFFTSANAAKFLIGYVMITILTLDGHVPKKVRLTHYVLAAFFYIFTRSEVTLFVYIIYFLIYFARSKFVNNCVDFMTKASLPIYTIFTCLAIIIFPHKPFDMFNTIMTGRIELLQRTFLHYGLSIFGQIVELPRFVQNTDGTRTFICLDNTIASIIINYGCVYLLPLLILPFMCKKCLNFYEKVVWCIYSIEFLMLDGMLSPFVIFPFLILVGKYFSGRNNETLFNKHQERSCAR